MSDMKVSKYNYIINCIIVAVVILVATSCSKDKSGDSGSSNLTKQRLVSELSVESDDGDWRVIIYLDYDNRNRVNRIQYQEFEDGDSYTNFYDVYYYDNVVEYVSSYGYSLYAELNNEGYVEIIEDDDIIGEEIVSDDEFEIPEDVDLEEILIPEFIEEESSEVSEAE